MGRIGAKVMHLPMLNSFVMSTSRVSYKGTLTSSFANVDATPFPFSLDLVFLLERFFHFPPSTCVLVKLARFSMKASSKLSVNGIFGVFFLDNLGTNHTWKDEKEATPLGSLCETWCYMLWGYVRFPGDWGARQWHLRPTTHDKISRRTC